MPQRVHPPLKNERRLFWLIAALIGLSYVGALNVPSFLDDAIIRGGFYKVDHLSPASLFRASFQNAYTPNRPVANLTLALNSHFAKGGSLFLFHAVNIVIHLLAFLCLYLFLKELLALPGILRKYRDKAAPLALAAAALWAVHPIQTQAVTYVIQRMTSLCVLFYFLSLYAYLKARTSGRLGYYALCLGGFLLALGTKEIGVTLPAAVFLLEAFFFAPNKKKFWAATLAVVAAVSIVVVVFFNDDFKAAVHILQSGSYANRGFTMAERLLTEPRVFLHYISLTVFPFYTRYILDYDYPPSRSLVVPPSTLFGIAFIVLTLGLAVWLMKRNKILSLSIILFWLGHVVEGSFLNLELVFEHRMYMPSAFLILIAVLLVAGLEGRWGLSSKVLAAAGAAIFVYLGLNTVLRNGVWRDPIRFYELNIEKAPQFFRPYHNLGVYLGGIHQDEKALSYFFKAAELNPKNFQTYEALGETYFTLKNDELAIKYFEKAESLDRLYSIAYSDMAISYMRLGRGEDALRTVAESLKIHAKDPELLATAGTIILYCLQKRSVPTAELDKYGFDEARALQMLEASFEAGYRSKDLYLNLTAAYARKSERETDEGARRLLQKKVEELAAEARRIFPEDSATKKNLISSYLLQGRWKELLAMPEMSKNDLFQVALPLMNSSRIAEALDVLKAMEARFGRDPFIEFNQAICRYMLGSQPLAVEVFKRYAGDPSYPELKAQAENYLKDWEKRRVRK